MLDPSASGEDLFRTECGNGHKFEVRVIGRAKDEGEKSWRLYVRLKKLGGPR